MAKYEAPREDGLKGYIVTVRNWGQIEWRVAYAENATAARHVAIGRPTTGTYVLGVHRKLAEPAPTTEVADV